MMNVKEVRQNEDIDGIENGHGVVQSETLLGDMQRKETNANENNITVCEKNARGLSNGDGSRGRKMEPREGKGMKMEMRENEGQKMEMRMRESDGKKIELRDSEERKTESSENEEMMKEEQLRDGGEEDEEGNWDADSNEKDWNKDEEQDKDNDDDDEEKETVNEQQPIAFEDVMELVGTRGPWNFFIFVLCSVGVIFNALLTLSYQFLGATPDYWCHVPALREANWTTRQILNFAIPTNQTSGCYMYDYDYTTAAHLGYNASLETLSSQGHLITPCNTREFNLTQYKSTIVTQWDLVCERRPLYSSTQAVTLLGLLAGSFVCGIVADLLGRRPLTLISVVGIITLGLATALSPSLQVYIILNFFTSLFIMAFFQTNFLIVIETGSPSSRSTFGVLYGAPWTLGYMALPAVGYFIRDWQWLQVAITLPFFILLVNFWLLPESPRWLIQKGRMVEAIRVLQWAAKSNRRPIPSPPVLMTMLQAVRNKMITDEEETRDGLSGLGEYVCVRGKVLLRRILWLLKTPSLRLNLGVMCVCWFATTMIYYGLALNSTNISADLYLYTFLGGLVELPAFLLLWPSVMFFGRRLTLLALYLVCGACISLNAVLMFAFPDVHVSIKMILSLVGKMGVTASFSLLFVYTSELFPTHHRSLALGACGMLGRVGSIISPYVNDILGDVLVWAPSAVFSSVALTAFTLALNLPETRDRILPEEAKFFNTRGATPSGLWTLCKSLKRQVIATTLGAATEGKARRRRESDVGGQCYQYRGHVDL